ncbi:Centromere protein O [Citrus sinensis]|uniref:Centromere protein O n=1 Tax=Citrus sinensis TaxID=2711 RepID=A0ACB8NKL5_CITSI|nr:Centromere protein O [Citrus sinensis]
MESDIEESLKKKQKKNPFLGESSTRKPLEHFSVRSYPAMGEVFQMLSRGMENWQSGFPVANPIMLNVDIDNDYMLLFDLLASPETYGKRDSDKLIFERLQKEFEAARASQTQEICLDGDQWNDGLLATIRERVHMEVERRAMPGDANVLADSDFQEKITYKVGSKVICCLEGARIGIQYETSFAGGSCFDFRGFAGEPCEPYHCVLESKSFLEKMTVLEHTIPFFLPIREAENDLLSSNAMRFIDHVGELLQAYVDRREQVRLIKELYGNQIGELYHSLPYHMIEFVVDDSDCKITVCLRYADLVLVLPTRVKVLAWPTSQFKKDSISAPSPARLSYAEDALRNMSLPEAYAEIVLNLPQALRQMFQHGGSC